MDNHERLNVPPMDDLLGHKPERLRLLASLLNDVREMLDGEEWWAGDLSQQIASAESRLKRAATRVDESGRQEPPR